MKRLAVLLIGSLTIPASISAQSTTGSTPDAKPKKECRAVSRSGSRLPAKVCRTTEEWQNADAEAKRNQALYTGTAPSYSSGHQ